MALAGVCYFVGTEWGRKRSSRASNGNAAKPCAHQRVHVQSAGARGGDYPAVLNVDPLMRTRSEEHTSELQSRQYLVCRLLLEKKKKTEYFIPNFPIADDITTDQMTLVSYTGESM